MQKEMQKIFRGGLLIWPTALKRYEVDKVTQAGVDMLRAVKGSNPTPAEYFAFSGGPMW